MPKGWKDEDEKKTMREEFAKGPLQVRSGLDRSGPVWTGRDRCSVLPADGQGPRVLERFDHAIVYRSEPQRTGADGPAAPRSIAFHQVIMSRVFKRLDATEGPFVGGNEPNLAELWIYTGTLFFKVWCKKEEDRKRRKMILFELLLHCTGWHR